MRVPVSWLKEYVDIDIPIELLAERLTLAGLEVGGIEYIGVPQTVVAGVRWPVSHHLVWEREKLLLCAIREVKAHPNADKLVLAMVDYGGPELEQCVTGAPNLFEYKDKGPLNPPLWAVFAAEGAEVWDGHSDEPKRMILKERALRGIPNRSMVCSEKELGISDEHEGIIVLEEAAKFVPGTPIQDVLGDIILDVELTPNLARCFSIVGVAREVAALLGKETLYPPYRFHAEGAPIAGQVSIEIREPDLNPRFTLALLHDAEIKPSPQWIQRRLRLVGQRPINNIVDITNYVTFEIGQPLHAFDYDKLVARAGGSAPAIITRLPEPDETLTTLDGVERKLDEYNILVCDTAGVLSLGGVIGGAETEISPETKTVLLEAANWNFINIRRTMQSQKVQTDAGARFSRGVHPSQAILGLQRGIELMRQISGGVIAQGVIDEYPLKPPTLRIELPVAEVHRLLGMDFEAEQAANLLRRLEFKVTLDGDTLQVLAPDYRMDISDEIVTGQADLIEEIARIYGYDNIPNTIIADEMPPQHANEQHEREEKTRDILVALGLRETVSYRLTTPEREAMLIPPGISAPEDAPGYIELANPIAPDKTVLRHTLLSSLLENAINNQRYTNRLQIFEIGNVYFKREGQQLPDEPRRLGILLTGPRRVAGWTHDEPDANVDYFDLKGVIEGLIHSLHTGEVHYNRAAHPSFHPGRSAQVMLNKTEIGTFGELHPLVARAFGLTGAPILIAELDLEALLEQTQDRHSVQPLPTTPPVLQDIALVINEETPAAAVEKVIIKAGGDLLKGIRLFDVYRGEPIAAGHKSLAYNLTYQTNERTLTDNEVTKIHQKIVKAVERELGAKLRA